MNENFTNVKRMYQDFVEKEKAYYQKQISFSDPERMYHQIGRRSDVMGRIADLITDFAEQSDKILKAFSDYNEQMRNIAGPEYRNDVFDSVLNSMIKLIHEREEIYKWACELSDEVEMLEGNKVPLMNAADLEKQAS